MINKEYADLAYEQQALNKPVKSDKEKIKHAENDKKLLSFELQMPAKDIIDSIKDAFKHIPPRI